MSGQAQDEPQRFAHVNGTVRKLVVRRLSHSRIEFCALREKREAAEVVETFQCDVADAQSIFGGGSLQITTRKGNLLARATGDSIWIVYDVPSAHYEESCLIPLTNFKQALSGVAYVA